jgi:hypothetical protein
MIGAVDKQHVGITQQLRSRQASETAPDDDDLFVRHEWEPETGYVLERQVSMFGGTDAACRETGPIVFLSNLGGLVQLQRTGQIISVAKIPAIR